VARAAAELAARRGSLTDLDDDALEALAERLDPPRTKAARKLPGLRVTGPHGFEVVIGRNARENDEVTFRVARSLDVWLHAQGVHGAHVVVRSGGREVPAETLRFAAELAAGHAEVGDEDLVLVDHTLRKHVWKVKGMPAGAVHYAHQRTLAVRPRRRSEVEDAPGPG
jgi:predicted ribosome quality control (RQC) complex YloA/Tae2 family protein